MPDFKLVPSIPAVGIAQNACRLCNQPRRSSYVRTYTDIEYEGEIAICNVCVEQMAKLLGWASKASVEGTKRENAKLREENIDLRLRIEELEVLEETVMAATARREAAAEA